jgi:Family of unknown function (DUF5681)
MPDRDAIGEGQGTELAVGYRRPPGHSRFKPGVSGNPAGRLKSRKNLRGLFQQILNEQVSLSDGQSVRKISKAEAALRGVVVGALRGDPGSLAMMLRVAEHTGEFRDELSDSLVVTVRRFGSAESSDAA